MEIENESVPIKVFFPLEQGEDGYPPVSVEGIWATRVDENHWQLLNIPFFVMGICYEDIVTIEKKEGELWFSSLLHKSRHSTLRLIVYEDNKEQLSSILQQIEQLGGSWEQSHVPLLIGIDIPMDREIEPVFEYLDRLEEEEIATYQVGELRHT